MPEISGAFHRARRSASHAGSDPSQSSPTPQPHHPPPTRGSSPLRRTAVAVACSLVALATCVGVASSSAAGRPPASTGAVSPALVAQPRPNAASGSTVTSSPTAGSSTNRSSGTAGTAAAGVPPDPTAPSGMSGTSGPAGTSGATGTSGPAGTGGPTGASGPTGPSGPGGTSGPTGTSGRSGPTGAPGPTGPSGPSGPTGTPPGGGNPPGPPGSAGGGPLPIYMNPRYSFAERAADLVSRMTLPEKIAQLHTNNAPAIPRLGVQQYTYWSEGQHGVNTLGADTNSGNASGGVHATSFPTNFASTMSWDPQLVYQETTAISDEARGFLDKSLWDTAQNNIGPSPADYGSLTFWAPNVNMDRDPRWGRADEAFGEDPYLVGRMAGAFVEGYQGETLAGQPLSRYLKVAATAKHYALNNVENDRTSDSSNATDTNIRDYYTAQFRSLIEDAHVAGLMTSYNAINGTPAVANTYTVSQMAERSYGFDGYTTSDCGAVGTTYQNPPSGHDWAPPRWTTDSKGASATWTNTATGQTVAGAAGGQAFALRAGTDLNCTGAEDTVPNIQQAIDAGILSEGVIDRALVQLFTIRMRLGEFDPPAQDPYTKISKDVIQSPAHQALAEKVAANSLVLLKNDKLASTGRPLLPADPSKLNNVVIVGNLANAVTLGGYSGDPTLQVDAVHGIEAAVRAANPDANVTFDAAGTSTTATTPVTLSSQTQAAIRNADLVIVFVGTDANVAGEGHDRSSLAMPGNYDSLISQVNALGNPRTVLAIQSDGPVKIDDVQQDFPAIVFSGYNGESQGTALADVLFGKQDPSGHLDFTWYKDDTQLPNIENYGLTPSQTGGLGRTYQYFTGTPTYPFGYGLSYTQFAYSHFAVDPGSVDANGTVKVHFDVTNTRQSAGATVAQVYVSTPNLSVPGVELPVKRLEGFAKTDVLGPGRSQHVTIAVPVSSLELWDATAAKWVVYDGAYNFALATDADHPAAHAAVTVDGSLTPQVQYVTVQPESVQYKPGDTIDLTGRNRWLADDTTPSLENRNLNVRSDNVVEAVDNDGSFVDLSHADVRYSSDNTNVAQVSPAGIVTMVAPGVATISATVDGVTGTAPVVVSQPFTLTSSAVAAAAGSTSTVTTTLTNSGLQPLSGLAVTLTGPAGWTITPTSQSSWSSLAGGQTAKTTWTVAIPSGTPPGSYQLSARATFQSANGKASSTATGTLSVPYPSLAAAFDNTGTSDDSNPAGADFDGAGHSLSAQALAAAGLSPGAVVTHDGLTFAWPNGVLGAGDNVAAGGQTIALSGSGSTLGVIGTGDYGTASGSGEIVYTDGTTQPFTLTFPDWWSNTAPPGGDILTSLPYINQASGKLTQKVSIYYNSVALAPGKTVQYVTLPDVSQGAVSGQIAMHVFALAIG